MAQHVVVSSLARDSSPVRNVTLIAVRHMPPPSARGRVVQSVRVKDCCIERESDGCPHTALW